MTKKLFGMICLLMLVCLCMPALALTLSGCAYVDANGNGVCDGGEALMAGVPVTLEVQAGDGWQQHSQLSTDAYGQYAFADLPEGVYRLLCPLNDQALYAASLGASAAYADGVLYLDDLTQSTTADIGLQNAATVEVEAYADNDASATIGKYERGMSGVVVEVLTADGESVLARAVTGRDGTATLSVAPGEHRLRATLPENYAFTVLGEESHVTGEHPTEVSDVFTVDTARKLYVAARAVGSFSGMAFEDMNNNGVMDEGEPGVAGVTVHLRGSRTDAARDITTDESGVYHFERLPDDLYTITADLPDGMLFARYSKTGGDLRSIFTGSNIVREFSVKKAAHVTNKNIGVVQKGVISGTAFLDLNYNGRWDADTEPGYEGVTVEAIKLSNSESMGKTVTDESGAFRLENLRGGDYRLRAILPDDGSVFTMVGQGSADEVNLFAQRASRRENSIQPLSIESGGEAHALIGVAQGATIEGTVFQDADYNGRLNGREKVFSGVKVYAVDEHGAIAASDTTGKKGQYVLSGLMPGSYVIQVQRKNDFGFTRLRPDEKGGSHITVLQGDFGVTAPIALSMGETLEDVNAGMLPSATVTGQFFHDLNDNGLWEEDEPGMVDAQVRLYSEDAEMDLVQTPAADGSYFFDGVMPGSYTLTYLLPEHCEMARTAKGGNTVAHDGLQTQTKSFKIEMDEDYEAPLAGALALGSFEGFVFNDSDASGEQDGGEQALAGAVISLMPSHGEAFTATSADDGSFSLTGLRPDTYTLNVELPDGYIFSAPLTADGLPFNAVASQRLTCAWETLVNRSEKAIGAVRPATISGEVWMDENQDGTQTDDEWLMEGLEVLLIDESDGSTAASSLTASDGFRFAQVRPGSYTVRFTLPQDASPADDALSTFQQVGGFMEQSGVRVAQGETRSDLHTGLVSRTSIGGTMVLEEGDVRTGVSGATITLMLDGEVIASTTTGPEGDYRFDGLWPGEYTLHSELPRDMIFVRPGDPNYDETASIIDDVATGLSVSIHLEMAQHQLRSNILLIKPGRVGDLAWLDENQNGLLDGAERRLPNVRVSLVQDGQTIYTVTTDASGYYLFDDVYPGHYTLQAEAWPQLSPTKPVPSLRIISSCLTSGDGTLAQSDAFDVASGETNRNFDLGYILLNGQSLPAEAQVEAPSRNWSLPNMPRD